MHQSRLTLNRPRLKPLPQRPNHRITTTRRKIHNIIHQTNNLNLQTFPKHTHITHITPHPKIATTKQLPTNKPYATTPKHKTTKKDFAHQQPKQQHQKTPSKQLKQNTKHN